MNCTTVAPPQPPKGWLEYRFTVLVDDSLGLLRADRDIRALEVALNDAAEGAEVFTAAPDFCGGRARLTSFDGSVESAAVEVPMEILPIFQCLADGPWLIAARFAAHGEHNCHLYSSDDRPAGSFAMGDDVAHIRCAADGTIWVGYHDQGVLGGPAEDGSQWVSAAGLAQFAPGGTVLLGYNDKVLAGRHRRHSVSQPEGRG